MKHLISIFAALCLMVGIAGCNDDPKITFFPQAGTYSVGENMTLQVTLDGFSITDTKAGAVFESTDGKIATLTLIGILDGSTPTAIGGVVITHTPDGKGLAFEGKMVLSESEMLVFKGTIIDGKMTLDLQRIPLTN